MAGKGGDGGESFRQAVMSTVGLHLQDVKEKLHASSDGKRPVYAEP